MLRSCVLKCSKRKREIRERTIKGIRYREVPEYRCYLAGEDGSVWKGELDEPASHWFRPKRQYRRSSSHVYAMINFTEIGQGTKRLGELVLRAFGKPPTEKYRHLGYRDGNPENLCPSNLYWSDRTWKKSRTENSLCPGERQPRGVFTTPGVKVIPLTLDQEDSDKENHHACPESRPANPADHLPDR